MAQLSTHANKIYGDIGRFIEKAIPDAVGHIVQAIQNNLPIPKNGIVITLLFDKNLDYTFTTYDAEKEQAGLHNSVEARIQLDFYGSDAANRSRIIESLWRSWYGCDNLTVCQPLYVQSALRAPYINESKLYEDRYILDLALQYNPMVTVPMEFTQEADIDIKPISTKED